MKKITLLLILITTYFGYAQPSNNAVAPIARNASDVKAVYGTNTGSYTNIAGINYNPNWGQSGTVSTTFNPGTGDLLLKYANFNYQGTDWAGTPQNLSSMEYLHVDLWTAANPAATTIQVSPVNSTGTTEFLVTIPYTTGTWKSIDIPKSAFTGMTWSSVIQLKFAANGAGSTVPVDIYLDNMYFWKAPAATGTDATLSDIKVNGTTLAGFSSGTTTYTYELAIGTTIVPQITSTTKTDPTATVTSITQATSIPGTATVVVKSQNTLVTKTYTISFVATLPNENIEKAVCARFTVIN